MVMQRRFEDCCIGDTVKFQEGDIAPGASVLLVQRKSMSYQPLPSQMRTWGRRNAPYQFRLNNEGVLVRYA